MSRVGGSAQTRAMRNVQGRLRLDLAQFRALAAFAQFSSDLDATTKAQIDRGQRLQVILNQPQYAPLDLADQVMLIYVATNGFLDDVPVSKVPQWRNDFLEYLQNTRPDVRRTVYDQRLEKKFPSPDTKQLMDDMINEFKAANSYTE